MLNNYDPKSRVRPGIIGSVFKRKNLSLNLHTMPQTVASHWNKWLILGFAVLGVLALGAFILYAFLP